MSTVYYNVKNRSSGVATYKIPELGVIKSIDLAYGYGYFIAFE